jgi:Mrp family chromosome partitioning ATPase
LVVQANSTHREAARKAKESLASANVRLLGAVLNKRTFPIPEFLYRKI